MPNRPIRLPDRRSIQRPPPRPRRRGGLLELGPPPSPSAAPTERNPTPGASASPIPHPARPSAPSSTAPRATDIVLRLEQGGGFVPIEYLATQAPSFTLYGNGVVVFQQNAGRLPAARRERRPQADPVADGHARRGPDPGAARVRARTGRPGHGPDSYIAGGVADVPDTIFTIRAGGVDKTVVVSALGMDTVNGPDTAARAAFSRLAARLQDFDRGGSDRHRRLPGRSIARHPERSRGRAGIAVVDWPWPARQAGRLQARRQRWVGDRRPDRPASDDDARGDRALKLAGIEGGVHGFSLRGPDGKTYSFASRPLLVDEKE